MITKKKNQLCLPGVFFIAAQGGNEGCFNPLIVVSPSLSVFSSHKLTGLGVIGFSNGIIKIQI